MPSVRLFVLLVALVTLAGCAENATDPASTSPSPPSQAASPQATPDPSSTAERDLAGFVLEPVPRPPVDPIPTSYEIFSWENAYWRAEGLSGNNPQLTVRANTTTVLHARNADDGVHNIRVGSGEPQDLYDPGSETTVVFELAGGQSVDYICTIHSASMRGRISAFAEPVVHILSLPSGTLERDSPLRVGDFIAWKNSGSSTLSVTWQGTAGSRSSAIAPGSSLTMRLTETGALPFESSVEGGDKTEGEVLVVRPA